MTLLLLGAASSIHFQRWANGLAEAGVALACATQHEPLAEGWRAGVSLHRLPVRGPAGYLLNALALKRLAGRIGATLLHAHYASGYGLLATASGLRPRLVSVWGSDVYAFPDRSPLHRRLLRAIVRGADGLTSTSHAMAARLRAVAGADLRIDIVPFGIDMQAFAPRPDVPAVRENASTVVFGCVKTLAPIYGIDVLLKAFARLRSEALTRSEKLALRIVGDGPARAELQALARNLDLGDSVRFLGPVPHARVPSVLAELDVFVAPSRSESFGVAVVEASACGLPVIASAVGGLPEVVEEGVTGLLVPPDDVDALGAAMRALAFDPERRLRMGRAGRAHVERLYDWPACIEAMRRCYLSLDGSMAATADRRAA